MLRRASLERLIGGTVRARAVRVLRDRIVTGDIPAGTRIDLDALTEEFGTSRTPIREALLQLSFEGLVSIAPRSAITVVGMTPEDMLDSFEILATLSGRAAEWAATRANGDEIDELRASARATADLPPDPGAIVEANWAFHRAVNNAARSVRLRNHLRLAVQVVPSNFFEVFPDHEQHLVSEHFDLVEAIASRDAPLAHEIAAQHVRRAGTALADWLATRQPSADAVMPHEH